MARPSGNPQPSQKEWIEGGAKNPDDFDAEAGGGQGRQDEISRRAYQIWEEEGRPEGRHDEHWQRAERELRKQ